MIVINSLFPILVLLFIGRVLKGSGLTDTVFLQTADKLIYFFFFPVMLFWKIGGASFQDGIDWYFVLACVCTVLSMFILSSVAIKLFRVSAFQAGSFSQSCYRFNTYIGVAVILNALGAEGVKYFGVVLGLVIPLINLFAVSVLIWYSGQDLGPFKRLQITTKAVVSNPLILACLAGMGYSETVGYFPTFIDNSLSLISMVALPLALISIGGSLTFRGVRENFKLSLVAAGLKLLLLPCLGLVFLFLFEVDGLPFKVAMVFFALPASTAIYVLSSQLNSDLELASSSIIISTVLSFFALSWTLLL